MSILAKPNFSDYLSRLWQLQKWTAPPAARDRPLQPKPARAALCPPGSVTLATKTASSESSVNCVPRWPRTPATTPRPRSIIEKFLRKGSGGGRHVLHSLTTFHTLTRSLCRKEEDRSRFWQKTKYRVYKKTGEGTFRNVDLVNLTLADVITLNTPF